MHTFIRSYILNSYLNLMSFYSCILYEWPQPMQILSLQILYIFFCSFIRLAAEFLWAFTHVQWPSSSDLTPILIFIFPGSRPNLEWKNCSLVHTTEWWGKWWKLSWNLMNIKLNQNVCEFVFFLSCTFNDVDICMRIWYSIIIRMIENLFMTDTILQFEIFCRFFFCFCFFIHTIIQIAHTPVKRYLLTFHHLFICIQSCCFHRSCYHCSNQFIQHSKYWQIIIEKMMKFFLFFFFWIVSNDIYINKSIWYTTY